MAFKLNTPKSSSGKAKQPTPFPVKRATDAKPHAAHDAVHGVSQRVLGAGLGYTPMAAPKKGK